MIKNQKFKQTEIGTIPEDWRVEKLKEICIKITDGSHFSPKTKPVGKLIATVKDMEDYGFNYSTCRIISESDFKNLVKQDCKPLKDDILIAKDGSYLKHVFVSNGKDEIVILSSIAILRPNQNKIYPSFLKYLFTDSRTKERVSGNYVSGAVIPRIVLRDFEKIDLPIPDLPEQQAIARILSSLDSKIELNNKMNKILEAIGQTIFKRWFINFEFPNEKGKSYKSSDGKMVESELGMIPEGWKISKIGNELKTVLGGTPDRTKPEYWNGSINWINSGEVNEFRIISPSERITKEGLDKSATKILPKHTTVLAITGATLGQVSRLEIDTCANQSVIGIIENEKIPSEFIYLLIKNEIEHMISHQTGGAQQHINKNNVDNYEFLLPSTDLLKEYKKLSNPIFNQIAKNCFENQNLAKIRDSLLPKLMSGEIRVPLEEKYV